MCLNFLKDYELILASKSPRRKTLLKEMGIKFRVHCIEVEESYPNTIDLYDVPKFLAQKKASPFLDKISRKQIVLTSDTVVILNGELLGKPKNKQNACDLLKKLSGKTHEVVSGVCLTTFEKQYAISVISRVHFRKLANKEIEYYVSNYQPMDKAGAYGIQEWIGYIGIEKIEGSYTNIVGLPTLETYKLLQECIASMQ